MIDGLEWVHPQLVHLLWIAVALVSEADLETDAVMELGLDSLARWPAWARRIEERSGGARCGYRGDGTLHVALDADDRAELDRLARALDERGLAATRVTGARARELEPHLSPRVTAGLVVDSDHQTDPRRVCACLAEAVRRAPGGHLFEEAAVEEVGASGGRVRRLRVRTGDGASEIPVRSVVVAAGVHSRRSIRLPVDVPGLRPVKGQLVRLRGEPLLERVVRTPDVYLIPRRDGELLVGATMEEMGFDEGATAGAVLDLLRHGWDVLPGAYDLEFVEVSVGLRSAVCDHVPVIGPTAVDGLHLAVGHFRNGILLAPATAAHLASAVLDGRVPDALGPFAAARLESRSERPAGRVE